jgi:hypothetical protein
MSGLEDQRRDSKPAREARSGAGTDSNYVPVAEIQGKSRGADARSPSTAEPDSQGEAGAPKADKSPRLREPRHHRIVRPGAGTRRKAITAAGIMLLLASALGAYTAVGVLGQLGANPPAAIPQTPMPIQGPITDSASNNPLAGVTVHVVGTLNENVSNADGWYFLSAESPGSYSLEASKPGFKTVKKTINVSPAIPRVEGFAMTAGDGTVEFPPEPVAHYQDPRGPELALGIAILLASVLAAIGGWSAVTHRHYLTAVAGAAGGTATIGLVLGIPLGSLLAVAALAILASLKTGFLEAQSHRIPWEEKSPRNRGGGGGRSR